REDALARRAKRDRADAEVRHRRLHVRLHRRCARRIGDGGELGVDQRQRRLSHRRAAYSRPRMRRHLRKRWLRVIVVVALLLVTWNRVRKWTLPKPPR